jgi:serine/threonine protein kinase
VPAVGIEAGMQLGPYEVQELVGRGAMGLVYRAYHQGLNRAAAVKVLQALAPDPDAVQRFRREAQAIAHMRHPNIISLYDFGELEGTPYMIVEYVGGGSLADRLQQSPLAPVDAVRLLQGIAAALDYAHGLGVVHRDVKPANVLMSADGTPILGDFGLAKLLQSGSVRTLTGMTTGTPAYMAPEQVMGAAVGPAADRYALATVAYELLAHRVPFSGEGVLEMLYAQVHRQPPPATSQNPELGAAVDEVLGRGLAKAPEARWESCAELIGALERALRQQTPVPAAEKTTALVGPHPRETPPRAPEPRSAPKPPATMPRSGAGSSRALRAAWIGAGLLSVLLLFGLVVFLTRPRPALTLSAQTATPGDLVAVHAEHLPPNQPGRLVMESSTVDLGTFRSDDQGSFRIEVHIPFRTDPGDHAILACWSGSCPASAQVRVSRS